MRNTVMRLLPHGALFFAVVLAVWILVLPFFSMDWRYGDYPLIPDGHPPVSMKVEGIIFVLSGLGSILGLLSKAKNGWWPIIRNFNIYAFIACLFAVMIASQ